MTIKPIDVQVNISQMHEVAKGEQTRNDGIIEKQHILDKESDEKSRLVQSRLEENKKAEQTTIMREEKGSQRKRKGKRKNKSENKKKKQTIQYSDERIGRIIDVKK